MEPRFPLMGGTEQLPHERAELNIYWYKVPDGYEFAAQDPSGDVFAYEKCPVIRNEKWAKDTGKRIYLGNTGIRYMGPVLYNPYKWHRTLTQRPKVWHTPPTLHPSEWSQPTTPKNIPPFPSQFHIMLSRQYARCLNALRTIVLPFIQ